MNVLAATPSISSASGSSLSIRTYQTNGSLATTTANGRFVVPAASDNTPGQLDLYVLRPVVTRSAAFPPLSWNSEPSVPSTFTVKYEQGYTGTDSTRDCGPYSQPAPVVTWKGTTWGATLAHVTESHSATLTAYTTGYNSGGPGPTEPDTEVNYYSATLSGSLDH